MNIAIDYTLAKKHLGGMGVFLRNTVDQLNKIDGKNKYYLFSYDSRTSKTDLLSKLMDIIREHIWYQSTYKNSLSNKNIDAFFFPNPPCPFFLNKPIVLTIPDMSFYFDKEMHPLAKKYLQLIYFLSAHKSGVITTFSVHSKKDICKILKIDPKNVVVIPLAASEKFVKNNNQDSISATMKKFDITKKYILCTPGTFIPRKNVKDLIQAFSNLNEKTREDLQIVLVGKAFGSQLAKIKKQAKKLGVHKNVTITGYIKPESVDIINLYSHAFLFVYPSLYEGFGLPPLEAMQCGIPTIVYNKSSLPEIVGDAALKVSNHSELTTAIEKVYKSKKLQNELKIKGLKRSKLYSWKKSSVKYVKLFSSFAA